MVDEPGLHVPLQDGREHEHAPDAEDDAGNGGEQFHRHAHRSLEPCRAQLGEEDRMPKLSGMATSIAMTEVTSVP